MINEILEIIDDRIENVRNELKNHNDQHSVGFGYDLGALEELNYLRNEIKERFNL